MGKRSIWARVCLLVCRIPPEANRQRGQGIAKTGAWDGLAVGFVILICGGGGGVWLLAGGVRGWACSRLSDPGTSCQLCESTFELFFWVLLFALADADHQEYRRSPEAKVLTVVSQPAFQPSVRSIMLPGLYH